MISIDQLKKKLPKEALGLFENQFTPSQFNKLLLAFRETRKPSFRVNTIKSDRIEVIKTLQHEAIKTINVPFINNAYIIKGDNKQLMNSSLIKEGKIYAQSLSSMIPALILSPRKNEKILDIASAPGSKTTQIAALMQNTGSIDALEPDKIRVQKLYHNIKLLGVSNVNVINQKGDYFYKGRELNYDRVLVDVPCSGEGRFNIHDVSSYANWRVKNIHKYSNLQVKLLKSAIYAAKANGTIVYSTCTLNVNENEKVIDAIMNDQNLDIEILDIDKKFRDLEESYNSFDGKNFDRSINKALRIMPSSKFEGFFICKIKKLQ